MSFRLSVLYFSDIMLSLFMLDNFSCSIFTLFCKYFLIFFEKTLDALSSLTTTSSLIPKQENHSDGIHLQMMFQGIMMAPIPTQYSCYYQVSEARRRASPPT